MYQIKFSVYSQETYRTLINEIEIIHQKLNVHFKDIYLSKIYIDKNCVVNAISVQYTVEQ